MGLPLQGRRLMAQFEKDRGLSHFSLIISRERKKVANRQIIQK
jgi:hypothetical protein